MTITLFLLLCTYIILLIINKVIRKKVVDAFFLVMSPYVFIIGINNLFMTKIGFDSISEKIIVVHLIGIILFFFGSVIGNYWTRAYHIKPLLKPTTYNDINYNTLIKLTVLLIILIGIGKSLLIRQYGIKGFISAGDTLRMESIFQHLELLLYPSIIMLFDRYLETKKKKYLLLVGIAALLFFSSFIKYHIISLFIATYIYVIVRKPQYTVKFGIIIGSLIVTAFVSNYLVNFISNSIVVKNQFYFNHLWGYVGGSTIVIEKVENYLDDPGNYSIVLWLWQMITSLPSMFTRKLCGFVISDYDFSTTLPTFNIGKSNTNVVGILGSAYLQGHYVPFGLFMIGWGIIVQSVYVRTINPMKNEVRATLVGSIFLAFNVLSFFSSFFVLSAPWEMMVWAALLPVLIRVTFKRNRRKNLLHS